MAINPNTGLYEIEDIAFVNTSIFTETSRYYKKHGCYTKAPKGSREYTQFWDIEEDRRKNGMTAPGKLMTVTENGKTFQKMQEVHITGKHYGFLNYGRILMTTEIDTVEVGYLTGNKPKFAKKVGKKTIDFPRFIDGQYSYWKAKEYARQVGLHLVACKARRKGFSYMEGFDCADEINMNPYITALVTAYDMKYLTKGNQIMPMAKRYLDWLELQTDFSRGYLKEESDHIKLGYKREGMGHMEFGYKSELLGLSMMNNPDAPAGKDAVLIKFEESGKNPLLKEALSITLSTTEDGSVTTGHIEIFGTGGTKDANWADFEEIYYNPESFGCMSFDNVWDENSKGTAAGFFYPQQTGDPDYVDEHGNSLETQALAYDASQETIKKKTLSQSEFIRWRAQRARCGREAFSSGSDNIFPSADIVEQRNRIEQNPDFKYFHRAGQLVRTNNGIKFRLNDILSNEGVKVHDPILNFPLKNGQDVAGCYVEWVSPYKEPESGKIPDKLYRIWHDPYAHDKDKKNLTIKDSLGTAWVYERSNNLTYSKGDMIVASIVGRPDSVDDYNESLLRLSEYWNAQVMFENDRGDVKGYFARAKKSHLLVDEPDLEWVAHLKGKTGRGKGMHMTTERKAQAAIFLRDWLKQSRGVDSNGVERINLHYIYDAAFLSELLKWNLTGNFDRVSAALVGMYDIKETFATKIKTASPAAKKSFFQALINRQEQDLY